MTTRTLERVRSRALPLVAAGFLVLLAASAILAPAEAQLGQVIKLVYVHGALVMVGLATFSVAGGLGLAALVVRRRTWYNGTWGVGLAALVVWIVYILSSMAVTGLAWGQMIAWSEPRVRASALILLAAIVLAVVIRLVNHPDFMAMVNLVMGVVPWILVRRAEAIRHPLDPIGGSQSASIQLFFVLIVLAVAGLALTLIAWLWLGAELRGRK
ncbi:MAG: hypothetical protein JXM73_03825 [Anaerolineae bacterium]|nr:hypothetical protein [Anaerolineae bacterium]